MCSPKTASALLMLISSNTKWPPEDASSLMPRDALPLTLDFTQAPTLDPGSIIPGSASAKRRATCTLNTYISMPCRSMGWKCNTEGSTYGTTNQPTSPLTHTTGTLLESASASSGLESCSLTISRRHTVTLVISTHQMSSGVYIA